METGLIIANSFFIGLDHLSVGNHFQSLMTSAGHEQLMLKTKAASPSPSPTNFNKELCVAL